MDSSDDDDSAKSIPRPIYEATSAIDSPPPDLWPTSQERESLPNKRLKYVVSSPPDSANGSSSSNSSAWPVASTAAGGHASLTMKLTKVTSTTTTTTPTPSTSTQQTEAKPAHTSTPRQEGKVRVPKEMIALQRSHNESQVLTGYVSDSAKLKRRKSRAVAAQLIKQSSSSHSTTSPATTMSKATLKRSKSIPAPMWDSLDDEWQQEPQAVSSSKQQTKRRNYSMAYDDAVFAGDEQQQLAELSAGEEEEEVGEGSNSQPASDSLTRFRSRSKTVSLSSEERQPRRGNLRSENEDFARKRTAFLNRFINDTLDPLEQTTPAGEADSGEWRTSSTADTDPNLSMFSDATDDTKPAPSASSSSAREQLQQRLNEVWQPAPRDGWDPFCWKCRGCGGLAPCSKCLRSFHNYCVRPASTKFDATWKCPECVLIESAPKRPRRNDVSVDLLSQLLTFALERMKHVRGVYKLRSPKEVLPEKYGKYFVNPVNFESLAERIKNRAFHSVDEFLSEVKWMQHNALILDSGDIKVEQASKAVVKVCRQEANEIDTCAECYLNANSSDEWFVKVCTQPHLLLWAKLKGFPYWPAKAMGAGPNAVVNVRFFGKHDRANVPVKDCFLYSAKDPNTQTSRRSARDLAECIREVEVHIENIKTKIGCFNYAPYRMPYDPQEEQLQLEKMMPGVHDVINRQLAPANKTPLQFLIRKTAGDKLSIVKKTKATESGNESDHSAVSPIKKPMHDSAESTPPPPPLSNEHAKPKSSNYEVIPRAGDALRESRGCTVVLKRKSLETCKTLVKMASMPAGSTLSTIKRKHSQSDASSETSQQGTSSSEQRRRAKHARKTAAAAEREEQQKQITEKEAEAETLESKLDTAQAAAAAMAAAEPSPAVDSVVELVRRRQGVTITKIPREQQLQLQQQNQQQQQLQQQPQQQQPQQQQPQQQQPQQQQPQREQLQRSQQPTTAVKSQESAAVDETVAKQRAVERQQQQLISKVVPFIEIKREVLSEPEDGEEAPSQTSEAPPRPVELQHLETSLPAASKATAAPAAATALPVQIKEEVLSEEEMDTEHNKNESMPEMPPPPQAALPARETQTASVHTDPVIDATHAAAVAAVAAPEDFVRFVGDTTIQRLIQKQPPKGAETTTPKRSSLRGVPHGPLPASALSPNSTPPPSAPASPTPTPSTTSPKPCNSLSGSNQRPSAQSPPKTQQAAAQQLRVKCDKSLNATTPPPAPHPPVATPTSSLLKSNMVVIPMEPRNTNGGNNSGGNNSGGGGSLGCQLSNSNLMSIPVPPLRAVSKSTLQQPGSTLTAITAVPLPPPSFGSSSLPPPPLAGLTTATTATIRPVAVGAEPVGLLASALNGLPSDTLVSESTPAETIVPGVATALSELVLRSGPPKLTMRPCGPLTSDGSNIYPSQAGPLSTRLKENAHKITDYFISVIEDTLSDLAGGEPSVLQARIAGLTLENERLKQHYERQLAEMQRSTDVLIAEMRKTMEQENKRVISELRQHSTLERMRAVEEAKKKQWCANCMREAQLYCCWNTSYCDYPCQQMHWQRHSASCGQAATLQPQPQADAARGKHKQVTSTAPNPSQQQLNRTNTVGTPNKKWTHQSMISLVNPSPPATEVLKLPNNTFLRPVSLPSTMPSSNTGSIVSPVTLIAPSSSTHLQNSIMTGQRNNMSYGAKQPQPIAVQRYNIPVTFLQ
ncbi:MYND-type zinc finger-containing chromatin reader Zmynd8 isoform X2 [Drosophila montana]|uniref:MYND-type zinc finger-containing chromatin reader Zmynd8 isoform X2 n=1 Tax=Drosophila montana TaxID=40370 RepID=UPI00313E8100